MRADAMVECVHAYVYAASPSGRRQRIGIIRRSVAHFPPPIARCRLKRPDGFRGAAGFGFFVSARATRWTGIRGPEPMEHVQYVKPSEPED